MEPGITRRTAVQTLSIGGLTLALSGCQGLLDGGDGEDSPTATHTETDTPMQSATPDDQRQVQSGQFTVKIDDVEVTGFHHVRIPGNTTEVEQHRESGETRPVWGGTTYDDLVLERAFVPGRSELREWRDAVIQGRGDDARRSVTITVVDGNGSEQVQWEFDAAWIRSYQPPELGAGGDGGGPTESCTVAFDRVTRVE